MKAGQRIKWVKAIEDSRKSDDFLRGILAGIKTVIPTVFCALLCMGSAVYAVRDCYGCEPPGWLAGIGSFLLFLLTGGIIYYVQRCNGKTARLVYVCSLPAGIIGFMLYLWISSDTAQGIVAFIRMYLLDWKEVYKMPVYWHTGNPEYCGEGSSWLILFLVWITYRSACAGKKYGRVLIVPVTVLAAEIMVKKVPGTMAILLLLAGVLLGCGILPRRVDMQVAYGKQGSYAEKGYIHKNIIKPVIVWMIAALVLLMGKNAAQVIIDNNAGTVADVTEHIQEQVEKWRLKGHIGTDSEWVTGFDNDTIEVMNNDTPQFQHVVVQEMLFERRASSNLYLKDYISADYSEGMWSGQEVNKELYYVAQWDREQHTVTEDLWADYMSEEEYNTYLYEECLEVPEHLDSVKRVAADLEKRLESTGNIAENDMEMAKAQLVAEWMKENTIYSLELPDLPEDTDPIEYFLETTQAGYCMHYASASVMLLRQMGVPARYVSGYLIPVSDFEESEEGYRVALMDDRSHGWVEIYLDGEGWVPIEVTGVYQPEGTTVSGETAERENVSESESEDAGKEVTGGFVVVPKEHDEEEKEGIDWRIVFAVVGGVILVIVLSFVGMRTHRFFTSESSRYKLICTEMRKKNYKSVIQIVNGSIYHKLQYKHMLTGKNTETEYENVLKNAFTEVENEDWERFITIVKAAAFSSKEFTKEEAAFCFDIYKDVIYRDEV